MLAAQAESYDLGSQDRSMVAPAGGSIRVGNQIRQVQAGDMMTAGEMAALNQIVNGGRQAINLNALGAASSGRFNITQDIGAASNLVIPQGVTALGDFTNNANFNVLGNLINSGNLFGYSTSAANRVASFSATNIINNKTGVLSTILPTGTLGLTSTVGELDLHLTALNDIINSGTITSSGALSITAGGKVVNALPAGTSGTAPVMQAVHNVNVVTNLLTNSGAISSVTGNVNIVGKAAQDLNINGVGGTVAAAGNINIGDALSTAKNNINIDGGDWLSSELNIHAGTGTINARLGNVTGVMSNYGEAAHVLAASDTLTLGTVKMDGDPTYYNIGDISINGDIAVGEKLAILSTGNITSTAAATSITARDGGGQGYDIHIIAGANLSPVCGTCYPTLSGTPATSGAVTLSPVGGAGGNVDFTASPNITINANSTSSNFNGGNVTIAAFSNGATGGEILLPTGSQISAGGNGTGNNGNVTLIAGKTSGTAMQVGNITSNSGSGTGGNVSIFAAQPTTSDNLDVTFDAFGAISSGNTIVPGAPQNASLALNSLITASGTITASANVIANASSLSAQSVALHGSNITNNGSISSSATGFISASNQSGSIQFGGTGTYNTNGGAMIVAGTTGVDLTGLFNGTPWATSQGGSFMAVSGGNIVATPGSSGTITTASTIGNGGDVTVIAGANYSMPNASTVVISDSQGSATGGDIILGSGANNVNIDTTSTALGGNGGDVTMLAFGGTPNTGVVSMRPTSTILTGGESHQFDGINAATSGSNGNVSIIAAGGASVGNIATTTTATAPFYANSSPDGSGTISVVGGQPTVSAPGVTYNNNQIQPGSGVYGSTLTNGNITTGSLTAPGADISVSTSGSVTTGNVETSGAGAAPRLSGDGVSGNGLDGRAAGDIAISGATGVSTGYLRAYGGGGGGGTTILGNCCPDGGDGANGGNISVSATGAITIAGDVNTSGGGAGGGVFIATGTPGSAGDISISSTAGAVQVTGPVLAAGGGVGSAGGGGGGSFGGGGGAAGFNPGNPAAGGGGYIGGAGSGTQNPSTGPGGGGFFGGFSSPNTAPGQLGRGGSISPTPGNFGEGGAGPNLPLGGNVGGGAGGAISLSGASVTVANTIGTAGAAGVTGYNNAGFTSSSFANQSINADGTGGSVSINSTGAVSVAGTLKSASLTLTSTGDIGTQNAPMSVDVGSGVGQGLTINVPNGSAYIIDPNAIRLNASIAGFDIKVNAGGNVIVGGTIVADPITILSAGDIDINADMIAPGGILLVSEQNIYTSTSGLTISTQNNAGNGGQLVIVAGADYTDNGTSVDIVAGLNGFIDLQTQPLTALDARSTGGAGNGGSITLVAYGAADGAILLPSTVTALTGGNGAGADGHFVAIAEQSVGQGVELGGVNTSGGTGTPGSINVLNATPNVSINIGQGLNTGVYGPANAFYAAAAVVPSSMLTGALTTNGGAISLLSGNNITSGAITSNSATSAAGNISVSLGGALSTSSISASGGGNGAGGTIDISSSGVLTFSVGTTVSANGAGTGDGGSVTLTGSGIVLSPLGPLVISAQNGSGSPGVGNVTLTTSATGITGGGLDIVASNDITISLPIAQNIVTNGADISLSAGGDVNAGTAIIDTSAVAANTNAGSISISSGTGANTVQISTGALVAAGNGTGTGGNVSVAIASALGTPFVIGPGGNIPSITSIGGGGVGSAGGLVTIANTGNVTNGGIQISGSPINVIGANMSGGSIDITALGSLGNDGIVTFTGTQLETSGDAGLNNGNITVSASSINYTGALTFLSRNDTDGTGNVTVTATTSLSGAGGNLSVSAGDTVNMSGVGFIDTNVNQNVAPGGVFVDAENSISLPAINAFVNLNGLNGGQIIIDSDNGDITVGGIEASSGLGTAQGGDVTITALNGSVTTGYIHAHGVGSGGGAGGGDVAVTGASVSIGGDVTSTNFFGNGPGGTISITASSPVGTPLILMGDIDSTSQTGTGGAISITNNGFGGTNGGILFSNSSLNINAGGITGPGGAITLTATGNNGGLITSTGSYNIHSNTSGNAGAISISAGALSVASGSSMVIGNTTGLAGTSGDLTITTTTGGINTTNGTVLLRSRNDINLNLNTGITTVGASVAITAEGDINAAGVDISTVSPGNGGSLFLTSGTSANGGVIQTGNVNTSANGLGTPGLMTITAASASPLVIGAGGVESVTVESASIINNGVTITNDGNVTNGGITVNGNVIDVVGTGAGGRVILDADATADGTITFNNVQLVTQGTGLFDNGDITIQGSNVVSTGGDLTLDAQGGILTTGNVTFTLTTGGIDTNGFAFAAFSGGNISGTMGVGSGITTENNNGLGTIVLDAVSSVSLAGVSLNTTAVAASGASGANITVISGAGGGISVGGIQANGDGAGNGGTVGLFGGISGVTVGGNIVVDGGTTGNGGIIDVSGNSFSVGSMSANGGSVSGNGGSIGVLVAGTGSGISISGGLVSADAPTLGDGGSLSLNAQGAAINFTNVGGTLVTTNSVGAGVNGTIDIDGAISSTGDLSLQSFFGATAGSVNLSASSGVTTNGGDFNILSVGPVTLPGFINTSGGAAGGGDVTISSTAGIVSGAATNITTSTSNDTFAAGDVSITAGTTLSVANINTLGDDSTGGDVFVSSTNGTTVGTINTSNGFGTSAAGNISVSSGGGNVSVTSATATSAGTAGNVTISGLGITVGAINASGNDGGTVAVSGDSASPLLLTTIHATGINNGGGNVNVSNTGSGGITFNSSGSETIDTSTTNGAAGDIIVDATVGAVDGTVTINNTSSFTAQSSSGDAGTIQIVGSDIQLNGFTSILSSGTGVQGVQLSTTVGNLVSNGGFPLTVSSANDIGINLAGGQINTSSAAVGGSVTLTAGGDVLGSGVDIITSALTGGNAGSVSIQSGILSNSGGIDIGDITAQGAGTGNGGDVTITDFSVPELTIGAGGKVASINTAGGNGGGSGGDITVSHRFNGGNTGTRIIGSPLTTTGAGAAGGNINIDAFDLSGNGTVTLSGPTTLNTAGAAGLANGSVSLTGSSVIMLGGDLLVTGSAGAAGTGNFIVTTAGGVDTNGFELNASVGNDIIVGGGNIVTEGADITLTAGGDLLIGTGVDASSPTSQGGAINLSSGASANTVGIQTGALTSNGSNAFSGGDISLTNTNQFNVHLGSVLGVLSITSIGGAAGTFGGNVTVTNVGSAVTNGGITVTGAPITVTAAGQAGGTIVLNATAGAIDGDVEFNAGSLSVAGAPTQDNGTITISGAGINTGSGGMVLNAVGGNALTGSIGLTATTGVIILDGAVDARNVSITSSNAGVTQTAAGVVTTDVLVLSLPAGGTVNLGSANNDVAAVGATGTGTIILDNGGNDIAVGSFANGQNLNVFDGGNITTLISNNFGTLRLAGVNIDIDHAYTATGAAELTASNNVIIDTTGSLSAATVVLQGPTVTNDATVTATSGIMAINNSLSNLTITGTGTFSAPFGMSVSADGDIDMVGLFNGGTFPTAAGADFLAVAGGNIGSSGGLTGTINTNGGDVSLIAGAQYLFNAASPSSLNITGLAGTGSIQLAASKNVSIDTDGGNVVLIAANGTVSNGSNSINTSNGSVLVIAGAAGPGDTIALGPINAGTGGILLHAAAPFILNPGTNDVQYVNAAQVDGIYLAGAGTAGSIAQNGGTWVADGLSVSSGSGNADNGGAGISTNVSTFESNTTGNVRITNSNAGTLTIIGSTANDLRVDTAGALETGGDSVFSGNLTLSGTSFASGDNLTAANVFITGPAGSAFNVNLTGGITATAPGGQLNITSGLGQDLNITGSPDLAPVASLTVSGGFGASINLTAPDNGGTNNVSFFDNLNFFGEANITASGLGQAVIVDSSAIVIGDSAVTVNTPTLVLNGILIGNPLILNSPYGGGTIANSIGNVVLTSDLVFNGQSLAIIAQGSIIGAGITSITLNSAGAPTDDGGNLTMVSGINFTPATGGQVQNGVVYTLGAPSAGGSIALSGVTITTNSNVGAGDGGDVEAIAFGGSVTLGNINTDGDNLPGNVAIIAQNGATVGSISAQGGTADGSVSIQSAMPMMVNGAVEPVIIGDGIVLQGAFQATPGTYDGNILLTNNINAAAVTLLTDGAGAIRSLGGQISAPVLTMVSGTGGLGSNASPILMSDVTTLSANTTGNAFLSRTSAAGVNLNASSGNIFQFTNNGGSVDIVGPLAANQISFIGTGNVIVTSNIGGQYGGNASSVTFDLDGTASVTGGALIQTGTLTFLSDTGSFGTLAIPMGTNASTMSFNTGNTTAGQGVLVSNSNPGAVTLNASSSGTGSILSVVSFGSVMNVDGPINGSGQRSDVELFATGALNLNASLTANDVILDNGGNLSVNSAIDATGEVDLLSGGNLTVNSTISATGDLAMNSIGNTTINSPISANTIGWNSITNSSITINSTTTATAATGSGIVFNSNSGNIVMNGGALVTGGSAVVLTSTSGNIGTSASNIVVNAPTLSASTSGNVFLNTVAADAAVSGNGNNFVLNANSDVTIGGIAANNLTVNTNNNGDIDIAPTGFIRGTGGATSNAVTVTLNAAGSGDITDAAQGAPTIRTATLAMSSGSGNIGANGSPIFTNASSLTANTTGDVFIADTGNVTLGSSSGGLFSLTSDGNLTVGGPLSAQLVDLRTTNDGNINVNADINSFSSTTLIANGTGNINQSSAAFLSAAALTLGSGSGNIGSNTLKIETNANQIIINTASDAYLHTTNAALMGGSSANILDISADSSIQINAPQSVNFATYSAEGTLNVASPIGGLSAANASSVTLTTAGSSNITGSGFISTIDLTLSSGSGNIGTDAAEILTNATSLSATTLGNVFVDHSGSPSLTVTGSGNIFEIVTTSNSLIVGAPGVTGDDILLESAGTISGTGRISGGDLRLEFGTSDSITVFTDVDTLSATGGTLSVGELDGLTLLSQNLEALGVLLDAGQLTVSTALTLPSGFVVLNTTGSIELQDSVDAGFITLNAATISQTGGSLSGGTLTLTFGPNALTLDTDVLAVTTNAPGATLTINEANGIIVGTNTVDSLTINAGLSGAGTLDASSFTQNATNLVSLNNANGDVLVGVVNSNTIQLTASGDIIGSGTLNGGAASTITLSADDITIAGKISGNSLSVTLGASGTASLTTAVNSLVSAGGTLSVLEDDAITLGNQSVSLLSIENGAAASGDMTVTGTISGSSVTLDAADGELQLLGTSITGTSSVSLTSSESVNGTSAINGGTVSIDAPAISLSGKVIGTSLTLAFSNSNSVTLATNVDSIVTTSGGSLTLNEDNGITVGSQVVDSLTINAGLLTAGTVFLNTALTVDTIDISNDFGNIEVNANISGTTTSLISSTELLGSGTINGTTGLLSAPLINLTSTVTMQDLTVAFDPFNTTTLFTNVGTLTTLSGGSLIVNEQSGLTLLSQGVSSLEVNANGQVIIGATISGLSTLDIDTLSTILLSNPISASTVSLLGFAGISGSGKITATDLTLSTTTGFATVNTNVSTLTTAGGGVFEVTEDDGITLLGQNAAGLELTAGNVAAGDIVVSTNITTLQLIDLTSLTGDIVLNANLGSTPTTIDVFLTASNEIYGSGTITTRATGIGSVVLDAPSIDLTGKISTRLLSVSFNSANTVDLTTDAITLTSVGGGTLNITEDNGITLLGQGVANLNVAAGQTGAGDVAVTGNFYLTSLDIDSDNGNITFAGNAGADTVNLESSGSISSSGTGKVTANDLTMFFATSSTVATNADTLTTLGGTDLTINEDDGITLLTQNVGTLTVNAGLVGSGDVVVGTPTSGTISVPALVIDNIDGNITFDNALSGTTASLSASGNIGGSGKVSVQDLTLSFNNAELTTDIVNLVSATGNELHIDEDNGITVQAANVNELDIDAGLVAAGTITVTPNLTLTELELTNAQGSINIGGVTGATEVELVASGGITSTAAIEADDLILSFSLSTPVTLNTSVSRLTVEGGSLVIVNSGDLEILDNSLVSLTATSDSITVSEPMTADTVSLTANNGDINVNAAITAIDVSLATTTLTGGDINLAAAVTGTNTIALSSVGTIDSSGSGPRVIGGALTIGTFNTDSSGVILETDIASITSTSAAGQRLTIFEDDDISVLAQNLADLQINSSNGNISIDANVSVTVSLDFSTNTGNITTGSNTLTAPVLSIGGNGTNTLLTDVGIVFLSAPGGTITITEANDISVAGSAGTLNLTAGPAVTIANDLTIANALTISILAPALSTPTLTSNSTVLADSISITSAGTLLLNGDGTYVSQDGTSVTSTGAMTFGPNSFTFGGPTYLRSPVSINLTSSATQVNGDNLMSVDTPSFAFNNGTITGNPLIFSNTGGTGGTLANNAGDLIITGILSFPGQDLTLISSGDIIASTTATKIDLSSKTGNGGNLNIFAGFDFTGANTTGSTRNNGLYTITGASAEGGNVYLAKTAILTGTSFTGTVSPGVPARGGNVTVVANAGTDSVGSVFMGAITTSATNTGGSAGNVSIIGEGGVQTGAITAKGPNGGSVSIAGAPAVLQGPALTINGGTVTSASRYIPGFTVDTAGAAILVTGSILTNSTATATTLSNTAIGKGGSVSLIADAQIEVTVGINTSGFRSVSPLTTSAAGDVMVDSLASKISIGTGGVNASALTMARTGSAAGSAGDIFLAAATSITTGNLIAKGADNTGNGGGGAGGGIYMATDEINTGNGFYSTGNVKVNGYVDARGGNGSKTLGGNGGAGGEIDIRAAALAVTGAVSGASIITSGGVAGLGGSAGSNGNIFIRTFAIQTLPANMDLTTATKSIPVLPGGLFTVGAGGPVNGVAGTITNGATSLTKTFNGNGQIVDGNGFNFGGINVAAVGEAVSITEGGAPKIYDIVLSGKRVLVTPGEALALFDVSAGFPQGIVLSSNGVATGGSVGIRNVDVNGTTFTAFKVPTNVTLDFNGPRVVVNLPASTSLFGNLSFSEPNSVGYINFGSGSPVNFGNITSDASTTLVMSGTGASFTNNGNIQVGELVLARPTASALKFTTGALANTEGATGATAPRILLGNQNVGFSFTFNATGAESADLPVEFGTFLMPTAYKSDAQADALNINVQKTVALNFSLTENDNGLIQPITATVGGSTVLAKTITIKGLASTASGVTVQTPLFVADSSNFRSVNNMVLSSTGLLSIGDDASLTAGAIKTVNGVPVVDFASSTLVTTANLQSIGGITLTGTNGIFIGNDNFINANGAKITASATNTNADITIGDDNTFLVMGGDIVMLSGKGDVIGGAGNDFLAKGISGASSGGIELGSGLTAGKLSTAFALPGGTRPNPLTLIGPVTYVGTRGAVVGNVTGGGSVNLNTSTLNLTDSGAMQFDAVGAGSQVTFSGANTFVTKSSKPIAFTSRVAPEAGIMVFDQDKQIDTISMTDAVGCKIIGVEGSQVAFKGDYVNLYDGEVFIEAYEAMGIRTLHGDIELKKGALVHVDVRNGNIHVKACSNPGDIVVFAYNHKMPLPPGQELLLSGHAPYDSEMHPADGIGRRNQERMALDGGHAVMSDFSMITLMNNLTVLRTSADDSNKRVINRMLKTAAALQTITQARGGYTASPREVQKRRMNIEAPSYAATGEHLKPVSFAGK